jgi:hypothetical protein
MYFILNFGFVMVTVIYFSGFFRFCPQKAVFGEALKPEWY